MFNNTNQDSTLQALPTISERLEYLMTEAEPAGCPYFLPADLAAAFALPAQYSLYVLVSRIDPFAGWPFGISWGNKEGADSTIMPLLISLFSLMSEEELQELRSEWIGVLQHHDIK